MIDASKGVVNAGDWSRIKSVMARGAAGEKLTVGFIGGSITQGSLASSPETCYAYLTYRWWSEHFPGAYYINAGIGGTTSQFGVARVEDDLLRYNPDVVFVEFSVNDVCNDFYMETYEGLVRRVLASGAAVMLIHNVCYDTMASAEDVHVRIGSHYSLPCVSMRSTIYPEVASGRLPNRDITPDDLHPNDAGHELIAGIIIDLLERIYRSDTSPAPPGDLPAPLTANAYEGSVRYQNYNSVPILAGFQRDDTPQEDIRQLFRRGYTGWNTGDRITFSVQGTEIAVQYRKSVRKPTPIARVTVDGREDTAVILDGNFQEDWGDCLYVDTVLTHGEDRLHTVEISIIQAHHDDAVPFYLVSVIGSK